MRTTVLLAALGVTLSPALAADLPAAETVPDPIAIVAPVYTWCGLYIGGQGGASFDAGGNFGFDPRNGYAGTFSDAGGNDGAGFVGGIHVGYDVQVDNWVFGALADISYVDGSGTRHSRVNGADFTASDGLDYLGTVRGKVGYAMDRLLVYGTGGLAYGGGKQAFGLPGTAGGPFADYTFSTSRDKTDVGYTVGGGVSYLVTPTLSLGAEYLYTDLGKNDSFVSARNSATNLVDFTTKSHDRNDFQTLLAKASYHFN